MIRPVIYAADLFCGAGGFSEGLLRAADAVGLEVNLVAINHWDIAIRTHSANHPNVRHLCQSIETVDPLEQVPGGRLDLLMASPECTHHSIARGGKPRDNQSRATTWCILRWLEKLDVETVLIENVPEFQTWGPLDDAGQPIQKQKGRYFRNFIRNLQCLGYRVDWRVLNAADYGGATTRQRLFMVARKGRKAIPWPDPTHQRPGATKQTAMAITPARKPWRPAREIIDWSIRGTSIYGRKRPLAETTLRRVFAGIQKFAGVPFILPHQHGNDGTTRLRSIDAALPTITASSSDMFLCEPFLVILRNNGDARSLSSPAPCICAGGQYLAPAPFVVPFYSERSGQSPRCHPIDAPLPTVPASPVHGLCEPFLVKYNGTGGACSCSDPLPTQSTRDRFALVHPQVVRDGADPGGPIVGWLDILLRMLQPHELAAGMGFPPTYHFAGTREHQVRQIGNAVEVNVARALTGAILAARTHR